MSSRFYQVGLLPLNTEIVDVTSGGSRLVSTGGGYADVSDPRNPVVLDTISGVGTASVAITADDRYALYVGNDNDLDVVDIRVVPAVVVRKLDLPGDPDAVASSEGYGGRVCGVRIEPGQPDRRCVPGSEHCRAGRSGELFRLFLRLTGTTGEKRLVGHSTSADVEPDFVFNTSFTPARRGRNRHR